MVCPYIPLYSQPDDHHVERGVDEAIGLVQRSAYRLALGFKQVDDGLQAAGHFAEGVDQIGEKLDFHYWPANLNLSSVTTHQ